MNGIAPEARFESEREPQSEPPARELLPSIECYDVDGDLVDMPVMRIDCVQYNRRASGKLVAIVTCNGNDFMFAAEDWRDASRDYFANQCDPASRHSARYEV